MKKINGEFQETEVFISRHVPFITKYLEHIERSEIRYEISWENRGRKYKEIVPAGWIASRRELLQLADKGLSCNDTNSKQLIEYLDRFIAENEIPLVKTIDKLGNVKGNFIHPLETKDIHINTNDDGEREALEAFKVKGTPQSWVEDVFGPIKDQPKAVFPIIGSFASVLMHEFNMTPIIVDIGGITSTGKTAVLRLCGSVWGNPDEYVSSFKTTLTAVEYRSDFLNSYPVILDDSKGVEDESLIQKIIYQFANNAGKLRGTLKGTERISTWQSIMITSGENGLIEYTDSHGVAARVIPVTNFSFENIGEDFFAKLYNAYPENHGAIGLEFLKRWRDKRSIYLDAFEEERVKYLKKASDNDVSRRISRHYAFIAFVGKILNDLFNAEGLEVDLKGLEELFDEIAEENKAVDRPLLELERLLEEIDSKRQHLYVNEMPKSDIFAIALNGKFYFTVAYLNNRLGTNRKQIRNAWFERGFIVPKLNKSTNKMVDYDNVTVNSSGHKIVEVDTEQIRKLGFDFHLS